MRATFFPFLLRPAVGAVLCAILAGCGTTDGRVDPDENDEVGGTGLTSQDIRAMADSMSRDLIANGILESASKDNPVSFYITELRNDSSDPMDKEIILLKIQTELMRGLGGRVVVLDRSAEGLEAVKSERAAKRASAVTANPDQVGSVYGSDYVLKGVIKDRVSQGRELKSAYYIVTFQLTDLETSRLVWQNDYEAKFVSEKSVISR